MITGGQSFVSAPPAFSSDGKKLLVCTGCTVSVFSTSTGMLITELEGHTDRVTAVIVVPVAAPASKFVNYCWTSSLDGTICYWDFLAAELVKKVKVQLPIFSMVIPNIPITPVGSNGKASNHYAFVSVEDTSIPADQSKALRGKIQIYDLTNSHRVGGLLAETWKPEAISVSKSGEFFGITNKRKLHIWRIPARTYKHDELRKVKLHHTKNFTALAFHPNQRIVAGGDVTGRILIWIGFGKSKFFENSNATNGKKNVIKEERPGVRGDDDASSCSTWHWHPSEIKFLFFSSDGAYLYSGGNEGVIVVWQIDTGKKKFKPRLGSPLLYFTDSPDPSLSCVSCADNRIHLLTMPTMEIAKTIAGIKLPFPVPDGHKGLSTQFACCQTSGLVAIRTEDYCVQCYDLFDNAEISQVQVCERNFQPVDDVTVFVALVALSSDGSLMGTVDVKLPEEMLGGLVTLKFWTRGSRLGEYSLSTVIYEPHSDAGISALVFRPGHGIAVTSSFGGDFKVWVSGSSIEDKMVHRTGWRCQSFGSYKGKPMTAAAFSADGSVLAIAAETVITLWDPDNNILIANIGDTLSPITTLSFIGKSSYLVSLTQGSIPQVAVWCTSKLSLHWSYKLAAEAVSSTCEGSQFAVLARRISADITSTKDDGVIVLFDAENPVPVSSWIVKKAKGGGLAFLPSNPFSKVDATDVDRALVLAYVNGDHEYILFDPSSTRENKIGRNIRKNQIPPEEAVRSGYLSIYGDLPDFSVKEQISEIPFVPSQRPWETIFNGPSHVLPSLTALCAPFFESLLEKRPNANTAC